MGDQEMYRGYEQRKSSGKIVGERKYQPKPHKDIEKKLASLNKRINDLQHQRRFAYKNSIKVKKAVHNQINQIVKCFRARERNLLFDVDEVFIAQDSSIGDELSKLLSTYARCQTLYANIEDFKEHLDVITKISNILSTVNLNEKQMTKPLEFISKSEQMKTAATKYGCLTGDFVKKDDQPDAHSQDAAGGSPILLSELHQDSKLNSDFLKNFHEKFPKRERSESGDSFEIVDLLESIHCQEDGDSNRGERKSPEAMKICSVEENIPSNVAKSLENSCEVLKSAKFPCIEKRIVEMQQLLENLVTSTPKCIPSQEENSNDSVEYPVDEFRAMNEKIIQNAENESWLLKSPRKIDQLDNNKKVNRSCSTDVIISPADIIRKAFSPYFANENAENWLLSKN